MDQLKDGVFRVLLTHMMADPGTIERALLRGLANRVIELGAESGAETEPHTIRAPTSST